MSQGYLSRFAFSAGGMRRLMNLWPPFRGAGIHVREIAPDFRHAVIELRTKLLNRNWVGTHFGGSLFAMTDPFFMILMMKNLGDDFIVWDKAGSIRFIKPAKGTVTARIEVPEARIEEARAATAGGEKFEPRFVAEIVDAGGVKVAEVEKTLHIRRKKKE